MAQMSMLETPVRGIMEGVNCLSSPDYKRLSSKDTTTDTAKRWFGESEIDLDSSMLLYDNRLYARALFFLQQSNEKLAKGLLISMGFLTPKQLSKDWTTKALLGFLPKEPVSYRHRMVPSFLSDMQGAIPSLEGWLQRLEAGEFSPKIAEYRRTLQESKKGVKSLRKKEFRPVDTAEHLENEIKAAESMLSNMDKALDLAKQELDRLDFHKATQAAIRSTQKLGLKFDPNKLPSFLPLKDTFIPTLRLSIVGALALGMTAILDPLESVTRYPDSKHGPFDENDPYVKHFEGLHRFVTRLLEAGRSAALATEAAQAKPSV